MTKISKGLAIAIPDPKEVTKTNNKNITSLIRANREITKMLKCLNG